MLNRTLTDRVQDKRRIEWTPEEVSMLNQFVASFDTKEYAAKKLGVVRDTIDKINERGSSHPNIHKRIFKVLLQQQRA